jgi:hypothetical protein
MITSLSDSSPPLRAPPPPLPLDVAETICWAIGGTIAVVTVVGTDPGPLWLAAEGGGVGLGDASRVGSTTGGTLPMLLLLLLLEL